MMALDLPVVQNRQSAVTSQSLHIDRTHEGLQVPPHQDIHLVVISVFFSPNVIHALMTTNVSSSLIERYRRLLSHGGVAFLV
jgi:hypothetical protein